MATLAVPGATLYYETLGTGPLLVCISGANGTSTPWLGLATALQSHFTTCMYDRRGFSRSYLTGPQDYSDSHRIETDTDDVKALIQHLSPNEPATVLGNSSGAVVSLMLLQRHPEVVRTLVSHEPPAESLLPDQDYWRGKQQEVYDTYRASGPIPAFEKFAKLVHAEADPSLGAVNFDPGRDPCRSGNVMYWFEREFMQYVFQEWDLQKLGDQKGKLVLINGRGTHVEGPQYLCNVELGSKLGLEVDMVSGGHLAFAAEPKVFAEELRVILKGRDAAYAHL